MKYAIVLTCMFCAGCGGGVTPDETVLTDAGSEEPTDCTGTQPATMVLLPEGYRIDSTEVTRCQYKVWLDTNPSTEGQDPWCKWNSNFTPHNSEYPEYNDWPPSGIGSDPIRFVDWCDAFEYCRAVGKRLCGQIGGGPNPIGDYNDPTRSQWYSGCSAGGKHVFPYGDTYDNGNRCNDSDRGASEGALVPVGSLVGCQSSEEGYAGVFDMSGNVWEWEDSCSSSISASDRCRIRGGSKLSPEEYAACGRDMGASRKDSSSVIGFRCCSNP